MTLSLDTFLPGVGGGRKTGVESKRDFDRRVRRLGRKRRDGALTRGYLTSNNHDGLAVAHVRRVGAVSPLRGLVVAATMIVAVKVAAVIWVGPASYAVGIERMATGTAAERMAAFVMQAGPLTAELAARVSALAEG